MRKWVLQHPEASICTSEGVNQFSNIAIFQDYHGLPEFSQVSAKNLHQNIQTHFLVDLVSVFLIVLSLILRQAVARFMEKTRDNKVKFDSDRIVMSGGATGAHETVAFCLANPGDGFLVPTPYYPGYVSKIETFVHWIAVEFGLTKFGFGF